MEMPQEFLDIIKVLEFGAKKHGDTNWLQPNGNKSSHKEMHDSAWHHLAESYAGNTADHETGFHPALHAAVRMLMIYTRYLRGIVHEKDIKEVPHINHNHSTFTKQFDSSL